MRLIVTGGGTGGHVYPALSIARGFMQRRPGAEVLYVGARRGMESQVVPAANIPYRALEVEGMIGRGLRGKLGGLFLFARAARRAGSILREFEPDVVVGTGGYASAPTVFRAQLARIPTLLQEQNVYPGVTNRMLSQFAAAVAVPSVEAVDRFPERIAHRLAVTGNPVRTEILRADRGQAREAYEIDAGEVLLLAVGGSGGAETMNRGMIEFLQAHLPAHPHLHILYVTGPRYYRWAREMADEKLGGNDAERVRILDYLEDMPGALAASDLYLCRAGAMSLAEATAVGRPMVVVPSPNVTHDHHRHNARALERAGAAVVIEDSEFTGETLNRVLSELLNDDGLLREMAAASKERGHPGALEEILALIDGLRR